MSVPPLLCLPASGTAMQFRHDYGPLGDTPQNSPDLRLEGDEDLDDNLPLHFYPSKQEVWEQVPQQWRTRYPRVYRPPPIPPELYVACVLRRPPRLRPRRNSAAPMPPPPPRVLLGRSGFQVGEGESIEPPNTGGGGGGGCLGKGSMTGPLTRFCELW